MDNGNVFKIVDKIRRIALFDLSGACLFLKKKWLSFVNSHKSQQLYSLVKLERKHLCKSRSFLLPTKINLYTPSVYSFILILIIFLILFVISHWIQDLLALIINRLDINTPLSLPQIVQEANHYQNLIAILAGIGGIVFALTIFIAESFRDNSTDRGRVLLRESYIWPLTVSVILSFLLLLWGDINFTIIFPVIFVALFAIYSLGKIISTLLSKHRLVKKRGLLLKELMQKSIDFAIDERIADNILLSKLDGKEINLQFYPFSLDNKSNFVCFQADKLGVIKNINLKKLNEFAKKLEEVANKNGFSFDAKKEKTTDDFSSNPEITEETKQKNLTPNNKRYITRKFNDLIDEKHSNLICFDKSLVGDDKEVLKDLELIFKQIFTIKEVSSFTEEVRYELSNIKDQFTQAIKETRTGEVDELSKTYITLAEGFLEQVLQCGGGYNYEQARKERTSMFSGWQEVRWLSSDLIDLLEQAVKTGNTDIIGSVAYTPIAIARRSIESHDHYLFQEFLRISELIYLYSDRTDDKHAKEFLVDRSWRYIKELSDFYVESSLRKDDLTIEEIKSYKDFSIHFLFIFQNLMQLAFKNKDFEAFQKFKNGALKLFEHSHLDRHYDDSQMLEYELKQENIEADKKKSLEKRLAITRERNSVWKEISTRRQQMLFGMTSFIFDALCKKKEDETLKKFFNDLHNSLPNKIEDLTEIFQQSHSFDTEDFWGWSWWDTRPDEGVHTIQILEKLEKFYAVKSLMILSSKTDDDIAKIELPTSRDLAFLAEGTRDLIKTLDDISKNPDDWKFVLNSKSTSKVDAFKSLLKNAKERQENAELETKREKAPSINKIDKFKNDVISTFHEYEHIPSLFGYFGQYKNKVDEKYNPKDKTRFGVNTVDDKAAFFEDWHVHYGSWGENYGRNVATGVDSEILDKLTEKAEKIENGEFEQKIKDLGNVDDIVIVGTNILMVRFFEDTNKFLPKWYRDTPQLDVKGFYGWFKIDEKLIPVFEIHHQSEQKHIFVLNKKKLGSFIQQSPLNTGESKDQIKDIFYFNIKAFSEDTDLMEEFIKKPPQWLTEVGDQEKQKLHLAERILIQIYLRFNVEWSSDFKAYKLEIENRF